jgi:ATP-dependent helicase HrpA
MPVFRYPDDLPISARREEIVAAIARHQVVVLCGETGSGKTTQLPKMCWEARGENQRGIIGCTQPRRVAATSIARRVAEETGFSFGREIGCKIRFQDQTGPETRVKFMTDGILLAEVQGDPMLRAYSTIILDEAHERSLNIDFLLGHLISILPKRPDLHVVITSATIDTAAFFLSPTGGKTRMTTRIRGTLNRRSRRRRAASTNPPMATCWFSCPPNATSEKRWIC